MAISVVAAQPLALRPTAPQPSTLFGAMAPRGSKVSKASSVEDTALALLTASANEEVEFVKNELDKNPGMAPPLAKLIRSGSLQKALAQPTPSEDGNAKMLPPGDKFRVVPVALMKRILCCEIPGPWATLERLRTEKKITASELDSTAKDLFYFAHHVSPSTPLPLKYKNARREDTFSLLCRHRYLQVGARLASYQPASKETMRDFGFFKQSATDSRTFMYTCAMPARSLQLELPEATMSDKKAWALDGNATMNPRVKTKKGTVVALMPLLEAEHDLKPPPQDLVL